MPVFPGELVSPYFLVLRSGSVNKLRLRRPREFGRPGILDGRFTAPEESVDLTFYFLVTNMQALGEPLEKKQHKSC